jgi:hypothetical protein
MHRNFFREGSLRRAALWFLICLMTISAGSAWAQQKKSVPPPPKPADEGPSLEATMKFIQDKLNSVGRVNFAVYYHDAASGNDWVQQFMIETSKVESNPVSCLIKYHEKFERDGQVISDGDFSFSLKNIEKIIVQPQEQELKEGDSANGHPAWSSRVDPPVFCLKAMRSDVNGFNRFRFLDEDLTGRVAKAMVHAVELCGGGNKDPF